MMDDGDLICMSFQEPTRQEYYKNGIDDECYLCLLKYRFDEYDDENQWRFIRYNGSSAFALAIGCNIEWENEEDEDDDNKLND